MALAGDGHSGIIGNQRRLAAAANRERIGGQSSGKGARLSNDEARIKAALLRRAEQVRNAEMDRAAAQAASAQQKQQALDLAAKFQTAIAAMIRETVSVLNHGDLSKSGFSIQPASALAPRSGNQASALTYAVQTSAGRQSEAMLVFAHEGDNVIVSTQHNPDHLGTSQLRTRAAGSATLGASFQELVIPIDQFAAPQASAVFAEFVELVLPTFPV
jgi:hypothetical protein